VNLLAYYTTVIGGLGWLVMDLLIPDFEARKETRRR